jgi:cyclin-dependent kinase
LNKSNSGFIILLKNVEVKEISLIKEINNPHVIRCFDDIKIGDKNYWILEHCEGNMKSLIDKLIKQNIILREEVIVKILGQLVEGLKVLHEKKISLFEIRPENIFIDKNTIFKIGTFLFDYNLFFFFI